MGIERHCEYRPLEKQPLALVLIQLKVTPINAVDDRINDIKGALMGDYPLFKQAENISVHITSDGIEREKVALWSFMFSSRFRDILLDKNQVTFQVSDYDRFESFYASFSAILSVLDKCLDLASRRIVVQYGLRYIDQIIPLSKEDTIDSYLNENFVVGQPSVFEGQNKICSASVSGNIRLTNERTGAMSIATMQGQKGLFLPPDLMLRAPKLQKAVGDNAIGLIDTDASFAPRESPDKFDLALVEETFYALHDNIIDTFFNSVVSEEGIRKWE